MLMSQFGLDYAEARKTLLEAGSVRAAAARIGAN